MTDPHTHQDDNEYLWDRSGPVDDDVARLERTLKPLAFDPASHPLVLPVRSRSRVVPWMIAAAAALFLTAGISGFLWWRLQWPANRTWSTSSVTAGGERRAGELAVGQTLVTGADTSINIGRVGTMRATAGTQLRLENTSTRRHRVAMTRGTVDVAVWAPPMRFGIYTPSGQVLDMGCVFSLDVSETGTAVLHVRTGWVQLENSVGEILVPAGSSSEMHLGRRPFVAVYDDATDAFRAAIRSLEADGVAERPRALEAIDRDARSRDALTLLTLATRTSGQTRSHLLRRAAIVFPPPPHIDRSTVADLSNDAIWDWYDLLPLPDPKNWWANWKDIFRRPGSSR